MSKSFDVISFGSAIVDIFLKSADFKLVEGVNGGIAICELYGAKIEIEERVVCSGGGGTNTAVSFSRLGLKSAVVARLGQDPFGQLVVNELEREGVATSLLVRREEETDISVVLIGPDGGRTILVYRGPTRLEAEDVDWSRLSGRWFYLASLEGNLDLVGKLIDFAQQKKIQVAWNPGEKELKQKEKVIQLANRVDLFNLNREEMEELTGESLKAKDFWPKVEALGSRLIIVTDGRRGAYLWSQNGLMFRPAPTSVPVDETGAGDAFGSGFVAGLIKGMSLEDAFELAMRNGASVVQKIGAKAGLLKTTD